MKIACSAESSSSVSKGAAVEACKYAKKFILKGSNWIINSAFETDQDRSVFRTIEIFREFEADKYSLELNEWARKFHYDIKTLKKFSVGNCAELAFMAFYYILHFTRDIHGEVYEIEGGDHVFLVVGRKAGSVPTEPDTWGEDAYICDPWAQSNSVYPASEYLTKLKNYYYSVSDEQPESNCHHLEAFDKSKHSLKRLPMLSTTYLSRVNSPKHLKQITVDYGDKMRATISIMEGFDAQLVLISTYLLERYSVSNEKYQMVKDMRERLKTQILEGKQDLHHQTTEAAKVLQMLRSRSFNTQGQLADPSIGLEKLSPYEILRSNLEISLKKGMRACSASITLEKHEKKILGKHNTKNKYAKIASMFFNMHTTKTEDMIRPALEAASDQYIHLLGSFKN